MRTWQQHAFARDNEIARPASLLTMPSAATASSGCTFPSAIPSRGTTDPVAKAASKENAIDTKSEQPHEQFNLNSKVSAYRKIGQQLLYYINLLCQ